MRRVGSTWRSLRGFQAGEHRSSSANCVRFNEKGIISQSYYLSRNNKCCIWREMEGRSKRVPTFGQKIISPSHLCSACESEPHQRRSECERETIAEAFQLGGFLVPPAQYGTNQSHPGAGKDWTKYHTDSGKPGRMYKRMRKKEQAQSSGHSSEQ